MDGGQEEEGSVKFSSRVVRHAPWTWNTHTHNWNTHRPVTSVTQPWWALVPKKKKNCRPLVLNTTARHSGVHSHICTDIHGCNSTSSKRGSLQHPLCKPAFVQHHGQQPNSSKPTNKHAQTRFPLGDTKAHLPRYNGLELVSGGQSEPLRGSLKKLDPGAMHQSHRR